MTDTQRLFLRLFARALRDDLTTPWGDVGQIEETMLANLSAAHHVLPMIYQQLNLHPPIPLSQSLYREWRYRTVKEVLGQERRSRLFLKVYQHLCSQNLHPVVVKGLVLRQLYAHPHQRPSSDEDVWITSGEQERYHQCLSQLGFVKMMGGDSDHVSYHHPASELRLELHCLPFGAHGPCGRFNHWFSQAETQTCVVDGVELTTLEDTWHLSYLVCHAYQHFISCGVGIRQLGDVAVFSTEKCDHIRWDEVNRTLRQLGVFPFWQTMCRVLRQELELFPACCGNLGQEEGTLEPLLEDILEGGIYGKSSQARTASSQWTSALARGETGRLQALYRILFPPLAIMGRRYPYVQQFPVLLPVSWGQRWLDYGLRLLKKRENPWTTWKIGAQRVSLAHKYNILDDRGVST